MNIKLLLAQESTNNDVRFLNYKEVIKRNGKIDLANYQQAYEYEVATQAWCELVKNQKAIMYLDSIYQKFNISHPDDYQNRSLSVGDIMYIDNEDMYFVDSIGFKKLDEAMIRKVPK